MRNQILRQLSAADLDQVTSSLEELELPRGHELYRPGEPIDYLYFPDNAVISNVVDLLEGNTVEIAITGNEGMVGFPLVLGESQARVRTLVQVSGRGRRMKAASLLDFVQTIPALDGVLRSYVEKYIHQIAQSAACHSQHFIEQRCARWLLLTSDRVGENTFTLTQEFLAQMLGVHRPSVTIAARALQKVGLIEYSRGVIVIRDREGLEQATCECYAITRDLFGLTPAK